jgi:Integrase core domain
LTAKRNLGRESEAAHPPRAILGLINLEGERGRRRGGPQPSGALVGALLDPDKGPLTRPRCSATGEWLAVPMVRGSRYERCLLVAASFAAPDSGRQWCARSCTCAGNSASAGADRRPGRLCTLHRARSAGPLPAQPAHPHRPRHRGTDPPLRARPPGCAVARRVKKLGNVPDGRGWRCVGRSQGERNRLATKSRTGIKAAYYGAKVGTAFVHTVTDDHSRVAYAEIHDDETAATATAVLRNAVAGSPSVESASGECSPTTAAPTGPTCGATPAPRLGITLKRARPYPPQTNGKNASTAPWPMPGPSRSSTTPNQPRRATVPARLHEYDHHRPHTAIDRSAPITRLTNLTDQYS